LRRNFLLNHVIEGKLHGKIEVTERQGRRPKQLLDDLWKRQESGNWKWKLKIALCGELTLEEVSYMPQGILRNE